MRPFFKVCRGRTRTVVLIGSLAFKFPTFKSWYWFLQGLLGNMFEYQHRHVSRTALAPVFFFIPGGFLNVMPRCDVFMTPGDYPSAPLLEHFKLLYVNRDRMNESMVKVLDVIEVAAFDNFGYYQGRIVAIDYGHGREYALNKYIIERWIEKEEA